MAMKDFQKFLEEASVKGNPAFPGEGDKKPGEKEYLSDVEKRAKERLGIRPEDTQRRMQMTPMGPMQVPSEKEMRLGRKIMDLLKESLKWTAGKEQQLSDLANVVFLSLYQDLVNRYEIELDIKVVKPGKVKQFMDDCEDCQQDPPPRFKQVVEQDIIDEVHKRKFANLIIQGEAKNTKHILHSEEVKDGLEEIYGKEDAEKIFKIWDEMTKTADQLDWIIPAEARAEMMEQMPDGLAGACFVDWKKKEEGSQEEEDQQEEEEEYTEWSGEEDEESMYSEEEDEAPMERFDETPIIRARGIDFPMLLHESVKGLFEVLALGGIPEDKRVADIVLSNTGISDEPEDWKYGPEVASDIRDFVNKTSGINQYPNIREELFKLLVDKETMPTAKFLQLMRGILSQTDEARAEIDRLVAKVSSTIREEKEAEDKYQRDMEEYERQMKEWEEYQKGKSEEPEATADEEDEIEKLIRGSQKQEVSSDDYSTWSQRELMDEIDSALDSGDMNRVKVLSQYLKKESKELVLRELQMIVEGKNPHTK